MTFTGTTTRFRPGQSVRLPDGPTVTLSDVVGGVEHGEPVLYLTGVNRLGQSVTRWVPAR